MDLQSVQGFKPSSIKAGMESVGSNDLYDCQTLHAGDGTGCGGLGGRRRAAAAVPQPGEQCGCGAKAPGHQSGIPARTSGELSAHDPGEALLLIEAHAAFLTFRRVLWISALALGLEGRQSLRYARRVVFWASGAFSQYDRWLVLCVLQFIQAEYALRDEDVRIDCFLCRGCGPWQSTTTPLARTTSSWAVRSGRLQPKSSRAHSRRRLQVSFLLFIPAVRQSHKCSALLSDMLSASSSLCLYLRSSGH